MKRRPVTGGQCSERMPHCQEQCRAVTRHCWRFQSICQIEVRFGKCGKPVPLGRLDIRFFFAIISAMDERAQAILIAAAVIVAPKLRDFKDTPALRSAVHDAIRVAEYMARVVESRCAEKKPA